MAGCQRKAMGRTVGSQITMVHLFNLGVDLQLSRAKDIKPWTNTALTGCTNYPSELPKYSRKNTVKPSGMMVKARWHMDVLSSR
jgi:hypothetical protein